MPDLKIFVSEEKERGKGPLGQMVSSLRGKENSWDNDNVLLCKGELHNTISTALPEY